MAYSIPQQLEYKEKIVFGLNFSQLTYVIIFGVLNLFILRSGINAFIKWPIITIFSTLCLGFVFFKLIDLIKIYIKYRQYYGIEQNEPRIKKFIGVKECNEDHILNENKKKVAILKVLPINFGIKTQEEQESILISFQKLLNSIEFPIQICINTEKIDINSFFENINKKKKKNEMLQEAYLDYSNFLKQSVSGGDIKNRSFYIAVVETSDLDNQIKIIKDRLLGLNLKTTRLHKKEIKQLFSNYYFSDSDRIVPAFVSNEKDHIQINETYNRIITAVGYPRTVEPGFLDRIISATGDFDISFHIEPFPIDKMMINLNRELQKQRADLFADEQKGKINPSLEIQFRDTRQILEDLQKGKEKLFNVSLYVNCKADNLKDLDIFTDKVKAELNALMIIPKDLAYRQAQGYRSCLPVCINEQDMKRNITTKALSAFFPFTSPFLQIDNNGVWLGMNKNKIPIIRDIFKLSNPNGIILSQSGGGKSFFSKLLISRYLLSGTKVIVIDPQAEYKSLVESFNGQVIEISSESETIINPLDLMDHDYTEKRLSLMDLMSVMLGDLSEPQKAIIDKAISDTYRQSGIVQNDYSNKPPILEDLLKVLNEQEKTATSLEKTSYRAIINRLNMYVEGVFSFLNKETKIDFKSNFVCFDIGTMPKQVKPVMMFLVLDYVYMKMRQNLDRKILLIDEAWTLLSRSEDSTYIFEIVKTCRKFNMGLLLINQEVEGLLNSQAGKSVLANSAYTLLLKQKPAVIRDIVRVFNLSNPERELLLSSQIGQGILMMDDEHTEISIVASKKETELITTKPSEVKLLKPKEKTNQKLKIDETKLCFMESELKEKEVDYLLKQSNYKKYDYHNPYSNEKEKWIYKYKKDESPQHMILQEMTFRFLKSMKVDVKSFLSLKADIEFVCHDKKWGIEIETGKYLKKNKKELMEKINIRNEEYGKDNWFFLMTNEKNVTAYKEFHLTTSKKYIQGIIEKIVENGDLRIKVR